MRWQFRPLDMQLQSLLEGNSTLSTRLDSDGILHLIADYKSQNQSAHRVISIDPSKDYRLVRGLYIHENYFSPDRSFTNYMDIDWEQYESCWYVKTARYAFYEGAHFDKDLSSLEPGKLKKSTTVTITDFHPNVNVNDSEFTLDGLDLPAGTLIVDRIVGATYKYRIGVPELTTDMLEEPLSEAEFAKSIIKENDSNDIEQNVVAISEQKESEIKTEVPQNETTLETLADTQGGRHKRLLSLVIFVSVVGIILILIAGVKFLRV